MPGPTYEMGPRCWVPTLGSRVLGPGCHLYDRCRVSGPNFWICPLELKEKYTIDIYNILIDLFSWPKIKGEKKSVFFF